MSDEENTTVPPPAEVVEQPAEVAAPVEAVEVKETSTEAPAEKAEAEKTENPAEKTAASTNEDYSKNNKFDPSVLPETDNADEIRRQVEYYFGDFNLPRDKFLWDTTAGPENKVVPLKTLHTFKRMRRFQPYSAVVAAIKDSTFLDIEGEEGEEGIRRKTPYKPSHERRQKAEAATIYAKGFGEENPDSQFEIEAFFAEHGAVNGVTLRRTPERLFKGSVFVEMASEEAAQAFLEKKPQWKGQDLKLMTKKAYVEEKNELIRTGQMKPGNSAKPFFEGRGGESKPSRGNFRGRGGGNKEFKGDSNDWKNRRDHDRKNGFRGGRGGRGRDRGGRGGRDDRSRENGKGANTNDVKPPSIQTTNSQGEPVNNKRAREDDSTDAPPAKKVEVSV